MCRQITDRKPLDVLNEEALAIKKKRAPSWLTDLDFFPSFGFKHNILRYSTYDVHTSLMTPLVVLNEIILLNQLPNVQPCLLINLV